MKLRRLGVHVRSGEGYFRSSIDLVEVGLDGEEHMHIGRVGTASRVSGLATCVEHKG